MTKWQNIEKKLCSTKKRKIAQISRLSQQLIYESAFNTDYAPIIIGYVEKAADFQYIFNKIHFAHNADTQWRNFGSQIFDFTKKKKAKFTYFLNFHASVIKE